MRNLILNQAESRDGVYLFPKLRRLVRNWIARRHLQQLMDLDDYLLSDIGLTRDDLRFGLDLPRDVDPIGEIIRVRKTPAVRGRKGR